jgi:RNA polymerase sigma-70 factor (ECF subfamily)
LLLLAAFHLKLVKGCHADKVAPMSTANRASAGVPPTAMGFHTTHWTMVLAAREKDGTVAREALASLCSTYWYPLYAFTRFQGANPDEARDLTQEFFLRFLERHAIGNVQPAAGKFRSFLLVCLKNFLANERERAGAQRRGGGQPLVPLDGADAETRYSLEPADQRTPEAVFERRWAFAVLEQTMKALRREHSAAEKRELFDDLQGFLPGGHGNVSRAELAAKRGVSVGAIDVAVHRLRQRFGVLLREQVAQTVSSEAEVEEEIRYLISVIAS